ncbi:MAG: 18 kDa heat shock protein [Burkholderia plantarii]|nr:MAG: 18 kDa heat shock protein [Burkholderia plantarii]
MTTPSELIDRATDTAAAGPAPQAPQAAATRAAAPAVAPAVDIVEDAAGITLWADLPGVAKTGLDVRVDGSRLTIEATAADTPGARLQHAEWQAPRYARSFAIGQDFDTSRIDASLRDGVLTLRIARHDAARARRIDVTTA